MSVVFALKLGDDGSPDERRKFFRLPPPSPNALFTLRFLIEPGSLACSGAHLVTNYPVSPDAPFERATFNSIPYFRLNNASFHSFSFSRKEVNGDHVVELDIRQAGAFEYFVTFLHNSTQRRSEHQGYFIVDPCLRIPSKFASSEHETHALNLNAICLQTVVPKWYPEQVVQHELIQYRLGPLTQWKKHFDLSSDIGYNMIHFVPLQKRGVSNSPYSIFNQLEFSDDLYDCPDVDNKTKEALLSAELYRLFHEKHLLSMTDIVWNHTANNSAWLREHPESGYNLVNSPHLRPAFILDDAIMKFSCSLESHNLPKHIEHYSDLDRILSVFRDTVLPSLKLWEYFTIDVNQSVKEFRDMLISNRKPKQLDDHVQKMSFDLKVGYLKQQGLSANNAHHSHAIKVDIHLACSLFAELGNTESSLDSFQKALQIINLDFYKQYDADVQTIIQNLTSRVRYERLSDHGPKLSEINAQHPLVGTYFTRLEPTDGRNEDLFKLANNGWIWNADPLIDFAGPKSKAYFLREVIPWGDCVKLRYGEDKDDSPFLWEHMTKYTEMMAKMFHGFRIDNCHSTPIHVAQYFLDKARCVNPNLYVIAELFTGSEERDITFVSKLGINSLIRESMNAWDPHELSRLVHRFGGQPIGSVNLLGEYLPLELVGHCPADSLSPFYKDCRQFTFGKSRLNEIVFQLKGSSPHALFMDCTHDNETPFQKRTAEDALSNAALVAMSTCAVGSVRGYDELFPKLLDIVNEKRHYGNPNQNVGIIRVKAELMRLHYLLGQQGFTEIHVHHSGEFITITRQNPFNHRGFLLLANTSFTKHTVTSVEPLILRNTLFKVVFCARIQCVSEIYMADKSLLTGFDCHLDFSKGRHFDDMVTVSTGSDHDGSFFRIIPNRFPRGSVMLLETELQPKAFQSLEDLRVNMSLSRHGSWYLDGIVRATLSELSTVLDKLSLVEMNALLFKADEEERDCFSGNGVYVVPNYGPLKYAGIYGFVSVFKEILRENNLGHPLCDHLRQGTWALDYVVERLHRYASVYPALSQLESWLRCRFALVKDLPNFLVPKYFNIIIMTTYFHARQSIIKRMSPFVQRGDNFTQSLALTLVQLYGQVPSTGLSPDKPEPSLAAGLPHFSTHHMRCWGRDIFISLPGLALLTGQHDIARSHLLQFASCLRHGLIPNLLDSGRFPRFNARDAVWWFMEALQRYCLTSSEGLAILDETILRKFPTDDPEDAGKNVRQPLRDVVQEIMTRHIRGISFREWNAGPQLDHAMSSEGFDVSIHVDENGFVVGGNQHNCGTWMDKMGDSEKTGTKGKPATPRDGACVEIIGLLKSALRWLSSLAKEGKFYDSVVQKDGSKLLYVDWNRKVQENFERCFYVPQNDSDDNRYHIDKSLVNERGIYKDVFKPCIPYTAYQCRPNFCIAMTVAPELFSADLAKGALRVAMDSLLPRGEHVLGIRTLSVKDWAYRGDYDPGNDSFDAALAHGWNYHQGPEWVWVCGFFLRAVLKIFGPSEEGVKLVERVLKAHRKHVRQDSWAGLPELTNSYGKYCHGSCTTQAWSSALMLEVLHDLEYLKKAS